MKDRYQVLLIFAILFLILAVSAVILNIVLYKTWANNEHYFFHPAGYEIECEFHLFGTPGPCKAIGENGDVIATKTEIGNWIYVMSFCGADGLDSEGKPVSDNSTHFFDSNECMWREFIIVEDMKIPKCYSDKIDPIHGVLVANDTHQFNPDTCQWEQYYFRDVHTGPFGSDHTRSSGYEHGSGCLPEYYWTETGCSLRENED